MAYRCCYFDVTDLYNIVNLSTVEKYCVNVARHGFLRAANNKNVVSKAQCVENSSCIQDDEQVCYNVFVPPLNIYFFSFFIYLTLFRQLNRPFRTI